MEYETINIEQDERGISTIALNRPEKHNSLSAKLIMELDSAATQLGNDKSVRVVVLTGEGRSFCAGGDMNWMKDQFHATRAERISEARKLALMLRRFNELQKPLIGRIQGQAFGGGVGLMCVCDTAIAVESAKFGLTETRLGLIPATIGPYVVARIGEGVARRIFMSSRIFDAQEAMSLGLCAKIVTSDELNEAVEKEILPYLSASPVAVTEAKKLARFLGPKIDDSVIEHTIQQLADTWETGNAAEGVSAFLEKRKPSWPNNLNC